MSETDTGTGTGAGIPAAAPSSSSATSGAPLDDRLTRIETTQERQGGILERIEAALRGGTGAPASPAVAADPPPGPGIAQQIAEGVDMIEQRRAREGADRAASQAAEERLLKIEQALRRPQQPMTGFKRRLQRILVGKPDEPR